MCSRWNIGMLLLFGIISTSAISARWSHALPNCNGKVQENKTTDCGNAQACSEKNDSSKTTCDGYREKELGQKGYFTCQGASDSDHCGSAGDPMQCDCKWYCGWNSISKECFKDGKVLEEDPDNPDEMRQVCSYKKEKADKSCNVPG